MPSFILIHPTIWPQYTNVTDRIGQTDNGLIAEVAQKWHDVKVSEMTQTLAANEQENQR